MSQLSRTHGVSLQEKSLNAGTDSRVKSKVIVISTRRLLERTAYRPSDCRLVPLKVESPATQGALLHEREKYGHENQHVNRGRDHSSDDGRGDGFHHVGANAAFPENRNEARQNDTHRHAEVVAEELLQDEAPCERVNRREDEHNGFRD